VLLCLRKVIKGIARSEELKRRISESQKGNHNSPKTEFKKGHKLRVGMKHTEETKNKMSIAKSNEKSRFWKGGYSSAYLVKKFKEMGLYLSCKECSTTDDLVIHHKDKDRKNNNINNLECFCRGCHTRLHRKKR